MSGYEVPSDTELEANLLSSFVYDLAFSDGLTDVLTNMEDRDFWLRHHAMVFRSMLEVYSNGDDINVLSIVAASAFTEDRGWLFEWLDASSKFVPNIKIAIDRLVSLAQARRAIDESRRTLESISEDPTNAPEILERTVSSLNRIRSDSASLGGPVDGLTNARAMLADGSADDEKAWVVDGLLRESERAVIVAAEGAGKSVMCKQIALCAAAGIHPFLRTKLRNGPVSTLIVDLENRKRTLRRQIELVTTAMERAGVEVPHVPVWSKPNQINVLDRVHRLELERVVQATRPKLVIIGPVYRMYTRGRDHEASILETIKVLDALQGRFGCALILEHHAPMAQGSRAREIRPVDSSIWQRWPDVGVGIGAKETKTEAGSGDVHGLSMWRPPRDPAWWPIRVTKGVGDRPWPFSGTFSNSVVEGRGVPAGPKAKPVQVDQGSLEDF